MITIWHLPELHILDESSRLSRSPACASEAAVNRILLAPTMAAPRGEGGGKGIKHISCLPSCPVSSTKRRQLRYGSCWWGGGEEIGPPRGDPWPPSGLAVGPRGSYMLCPCMCDFHEVLLNFFGPNFPDLLKGRNMILEVVCSVLRDTH